MKQLSYAEKLKNPKWQKKRLEILKRDKFACKLCGDKETQLHVHHLEYNKDCDPWEYDNKLLITLCEDCHTLVEEAKEEGAIFSDIKIYKSSDWSNGGKMIFCYYNEICRLRVFNKTGKIIGFDIPEWHVREVVTYLKSTFNGKKIH